MKKISIFFVYASNKKLENKSFLFFFEERKRGKSEDKTIPKNDFWSTVGRRESLMN
jgi:hypothetical protein